MSNPFDIFNIPPSYALDNDALDRTYFKMQKEFHPDQKDGDAVFSSMLNTAYQTLKSPVKRAAAILDMLGLPVPGNEGESIESSEWLLNIFDFQEAIMICESAEEAAHIKNEIEEMFIEEQHNFNDAFDQSHHDELPETYVKLSYLDKLQKQLIEVEEQFYNVRSAVH